MSHDDDYTKRILQMVRELASEEALLHVPCSVCRLELCLGGPTCRCPMERTGVAIAWIAGCYIHAGSCLTKFAEDPGCVGEERFQDTRISGPTYPLN